MGYVYLLFRFIVFLSLNLLTSYYLTNTSLYAQRIYADSLSAPYTITDRYKITNSDTSDYALHDLNTLIGFGAKELDILFLKSVSLPHPTNPVYFKVRPQGTFTLLGSVNINKVVGLPTIPHSNMNTTGPTVGIVSVLDLLGLLASPPDIYQYPSPDTASVPYTGIKIKGSGIANFGDLRVYYAFYIKNPQLSNNAPLGCSGRTTQLTITNYQANTKYLLLSGSDTLQTIQSSSFFLPIVINTNASPMSRNYKLIAIESNFYRSGITNITHQIYKIPDKPILNFN